MGIAVEIKESFSVQSPSFIFGTTVIAERVETLIPLDEPTAALPDVFTELAAQYRRVPQVDDSSGGLPGDRFPF